MVIVFMADDQHGGLHGIAAGAKNILDRNCVTRFANFFRQRLFFQFEARSHGQNLMCQGVPTSMSGRGGLVVRCRDINMMQVAQSMFPNQLEVLSGRILICRC